MIKPDNNLCLVVLLITMQCSLLTMAQSSTPDIDSNKVLTDFIWSKIISNSKSSSSPLSGHSKSKAPHIPLVTIPYKPSVHSSSPSSAPLSRRSSYQTMASSSSNAIKSTIASLVSSASSPSYTFDSGAEGLQGKKLYFSANPSNSLSDQPFGQYNPTTSSSTSAITSTGRPQIKSSYSGSETGKNYFISAFQPQTDSNKNNAQPQSKSVYDLVPMPTYGYSKFGIGAEQNNIYPSKKTVEIVPMIREGKNGYNEPQQPMEPQIIEVTPDDQPIQVVFRSTSARVQVRQIHTPTKAEEVETTRTEEEPTRVVHQLLRPVIQEVFEVIQPYRRVTQEVRPVLEEVHTVVSKSVPANGQQGQQGQTSAQGPQAQQTNNASQNGYNSRSMFNQANQGSSIAASFNSNSYSAVQGNGQYGNKVQNYG